MSPSPSKERGKKIKKRGEAPLRHPLFGLVDVNEFRLIGCRFWDRSAMMSIEGKAIETDKSEYKILL